MGSLPPGSSGPGVPLAKNVPKPSRAKTVPAVQWALWGAGSRSKPGSQWVTTPAEARLSHPAGGQQKASAGIGLAPSPAPLGPPDAPRQLRGERVGWLESPSRRQLPLWTESPEPGPRAWQGQEADDPVKATRQPLRASVTCCQTHALPPAPPPGPPRGRGPTLPSRDVPSLGPWPCSRGGLWAEKAWSHGQAGGGGAHRRPRVLGRWKCSHGSFITHGPCTPEWTPM